MNADERAEVLRGRIEAAFAEVPRPTPESLIGSGSIDELWCARELAGQARDEIRITDALPECLLWLPLPAVQYYLPVFLLHLLDLAHHQESGILFSLVPYLDRRNRREYPAFTGSQRLCIAEWLEFARDHIDDFEPGYLRDRFERRLRLIRDQWTSATLAR